MDAGLSARLRDRILDLRDRLLANRRFRNWAAAFPLTRPLARRHATELFDICAGFVYSSVLLACVRLDLFAVLASSPRTTAELATLLDLPDAAVNRLLAAASALRLVERRSGGRYGLGPRGAVVHSMPGVQAMVEHHTLLYADLYDPVALLRRGRGDRLGGYWGYAGSDQPDALAAEAVSPYSRLMALSQPLVADEVLAVHAFRRYRRLLDVGGGEGAFLSEVARRWPHLRGTVADLPAVAELARQRFAANGLSDRLDATGVDFYRDPLPPGADLISLVRILHDHNDVDVEHILAAVFRALEPGGRLLVAEPLAETAGAEAMGDAYFGFYLLAMGKGRPRSASVLCAMINAAGFTRVRLLKAHNPLQTRVIVAEKPTC